MSELLQMHGALSPRGDLVAQPRGAFQARSHGAVDTASDLTRAFGTLGLFERVLALRKLVPGRIVFTTSFGLEDQAVAHAIFAQALEVDVVTLDTGRLFPETHAVWAATEARYSVRVRAFAPEHAGVEALVGRQGIDGFRSSVAARRECCTVRKVEPLGRALKGGAAWITGIRADQSTDRGRFAAVSFDEHHCLLKANPLFDWTREQTSAFVRAHDVPYNVLHDRGFLSIGCAPCTRAVGPDEHERAGRWWWEDTEKKECGLHFTADGRSSSGRE